MSHQMNQYPVRVELDAPLDVARWAPFVNLILAIPHLLVLWVLGIVQSITWVVSVLLVLVTGQVPPSLFELTVMIQRYQWRTYSFVFGLRASYPPFDFKMEGEEPDPAQYAAAYPERMSRLAAPFKLLLLIPHGFVIALLAVAALFAWPIGAIVVLITGRWPEAIHHLVLGLNRWSLRTNAYLYCLTDEYPPFSLD